MVDLPSGRRSKTAKLSGARRLRWAWLLWLAVPVLVYLAFQNLPLGNVLSAIARLNGWQIAAWAVANLAFLALATARWQAILRAFGARASLWTLLGFRLAGFGMSYYTPGPQFGGEPLLVYLLNRRLAVRTATAVSSVYLDRLLDLLANFTFLVVGVGVIFGSGMVSGDPSMGFLALVPALILLPAIHLGGLARGKQPLTRLLGWVRSRLPGRFWQAAHAYTADAEAMIGQFCREQPRTLWQVIGASALVWIVAVGEFFLLLHFLGAPVSLAQAVGILTAARLAFLLPLPGGLGVLEASLYFAMQAAGFDPAIGLAASLIIRARDMSLGLIGLFIGAVSTRRH